jgi:[glutamine synthetase] adenylyltransferase / [glutamine synthetase]-adenylyl-L-tyrosine phosphorylase
MSAISSLSRFVQRTRRRAGLSPEAALNRLTAGSPEPETQQDYLQLLLSQGTPLPAALRQLRAEVMERLVVLDVEQNCPLNIVTEGMTALAEVCLRQALAAATLELQAAHGHPCKPDGSIADLWIVGMGKLGARELNVSSDIDLIYVYDEDGETTGDAQGRGRISNAQFFSKIVKRISSLIGDVTEHGFVFRVDLALRPNGSVGPAAISLAALENYFLSQGREWERFAWLKARVVAQLHPQPDGKPRAPELRALVTPFVFRKYLDYNVVEALRKLHSQIRDHAVKQSAGRPERANDVKLGRGGIREIEFTAQMLQVVRGGQFPELRVRPTLKALERITQAGLMPADTAQQLKIAYIFLRQVEHRIQYLDDQQTHRLPTNDGDLLWIAQGMGFDNVCAFLTTLDAHREKVAHEFDQLLGNAKAPKPGGCKGCGTPNPSVDGWLNPATLEAMSAALRERIEPLKNHPRVLALNEAHRERLVAVLQRSANWLARPHAPDDDTSAITEEGTLRFIEWLEPLLRRESYLALLVERPALHERLLRVFSRARWPARYAMTHPGVIDELANPALLNERFDAAGFEAELEQRKQSLHRSEGLDEERLMNLLRRAHHAEVFRILVRDVEGRLTVEQVADDLSALADTVLAIALGWCWPFVKKQHRPDAQCAIIGYGKLGGKELGYGSDLDIVFVFDDKADEAPEAYASLVRKLTLWLSLQTAEGDLYEIDTALRPNGNSGLLITRFSAYADYQTQRGSNTAWTWEHQAMTRARFVAGVPHLRAAFDTVRQAVITAPRDLAALKTEIRTMRDKMREAQKLKAGSFDIKHSEGGMIDAEFAVQYLVLAHSGAHPELQANIGNIALLEKAEQLGLLPQGTGHAAADAYRELRHRQHVARLNEQSMQCDPQEVALESAAISRLYQLVLN